MGSEPVEEPRRVGRVARTGIVVQGMELSDIVEIGELLRLAGAIDEDAAADLVRELDLRRLANFCARDRNLGRQEELLRGLYGASRLSCLELVRQVYGGEVGDEALAVLLEENESSDNVLRLVRRLQIIAPATAARIFQLNFELGQGRFLTLLGVEADLHNASRWLRTCYGYPGIMPGQIQDDIVQIMREMLVYDERVFSAIEATVALVDAERPSDTEPFVSAIIKGAEQAAALRSPVALMGLVLRLMRVDQALNKRCVDTVLAHIRPHALYKLLSISESIVLASFTYHLFRNHISASQTC
ncbi:MAG: hypothetical protein ACREBC_33080, partial [Pyrinomonadaceae bacterium]